MGISVQTGHTKTASGLTLVSKSYKSNQKEQVILLLHISASAQEAKTLEKECEMIIQHSLLETEGGASERLDGTLKEINGLLKGLIISKTIDDIHAIIAIAGNDDSFHVSHAGRAEAYVIRGGQTSQITEYSRGKATPAFVHIASGPIEPRDVLVLSSQRLLRALTPAQLAKHAQRGDQLIDEISMGLEAEKEKAALAVIRVDGRGVTAQKKVKSLIPRSQRRKKFSGRIPMPDLSRVTGLFTSGFGKGLSAVSSSRWVTKAKSIPGTLISDLRNPKRKKKAHLLIIASFVTLFLVIWAIGNLTTTTQRSQNRAELELLVQQIDEDIRTAENRYLTGDVDAANAILERARDRTMQVMDNESGLFRIEALDLLDRIRLKNEEINNIIRQSPRVAVNLAAKNQNIEAIGMIGLSDGELVVYDRQDLYRVILNAVDEPDRLVEEDLIIDGSNFERMQTLLFQTSGNSIIEIISGQATSMKTEDPAGWISGKAVTTYLRFLYVLSPENNKIYKYERLSNRYGAPAEYNVNGELAGGIDITIDGNVYVLKEGGEIVKLFRGEVRPFTIRHLPEGGLENVSKIFKAPEDGNFYLLDPVGSRVIVATDGGGTGESAYVRQYILEGEQIGDLVDLYVDPDQLRLYVLDEKRVYVVDLVTR
ncbi:hypothetical protein KKF55_03925 [Patescibacteria group bacterium]|nr:hypothetical protein [Patescibacteria group bacterium]